ncbi:CatB-related O-acetyltransferase [Acinetobacter sp.]|uniref:CatB-related O-acetyltransferase n=1 Tax=Acinetobacter sp. TaxID=472 RepID=UPI003B0032BC
MKNYKDALSNETTQIEFFKVEKLLQTLNINMLFLKRNPNRLINLNNDLRIEGHNNFYSNILNLCTIGAFSYSSSNLGYGVSIGRYSSLATNIKIMGAHHFPEWISTSPHFYAEDYHSTDPLKVTHLQRTKRNVTIGNDVWIGADVILKSNINIGDGAIIASNSVVTKDVAPYMIVGGNPARIIRPRFSDDIVEKLKTLKWWRFHKKDLKELMFDHPYFFIDSLREKIELVGLKEYTPPIFTKNDLLKSTHIENI